MEMEKTRKTDTDLYKETAQTYSSPWDFEYKKEVPGTGEISLHEDGESWMIYE